MKTFYRLERNGLGPFSGVTKDEIKVICDYENSLSNAEIMNFCPFVKMLIKEIKVYGATNHITMSKKGLSAFETLELLYSGFGTQFIELLNGMGFEIYAYEVEEYISGPTHPVITKFTSKQVVK